MTTPRQIAANQRNSLRSTGPRSAQGKATSSRNAVRHGLLSFQVVLPDEDQEAFLALRERLWEALEPVGAVEELPAERAVSLAWRLARLGRVESGLYEVGSL